MIYIQKLEGITKSDFLMVGGKAVSIGELTQKNFAVPDGYVVTTEAYLDFLNGRVSLDLENQIFSNFDSLNVELVAVRSSALAESWTGQLETFVNVSRRELMNKVVSCWDSIHSAEAQRFAAEKNLIGNQLLVAVIIQKMIQSAVSGVMFTINPMSRQTDEVLIEAGFGLGEYLVRGPVAPDSFQVDKKSLKIKGRDIKVQETMMAFVNGENQEVPVPENVKGKPSLSDEKIQELTKIAIDIEESSHAPQTIEWAVDNQNKIWILQSRPTVIV